MELFPLNIMELLFVIVTALFADRSSFSTAIAFLSARVPVISLLLTTPVAESPIVPSISVSKFAF